MRIKKSKRKPFRPTIACRIDQKIYDACNKLADKRDEYLSHIVEDALVDYLIKLDQLEHDWKISDS